MAKLTKAGREAIRDRAMLATFGETAKALIDERRAFVADVYHAWPEGKPFYAEDLPPEPVVAQRHDVNKKLGLAK